MSEAKSEVFLWLHSISNGLGLERLAEEFESQGFRKTSSLKYIRSSDLDVLFPWLHKLLLAEKRIMETKLEQLKRREENPGQKAQTLPPRELFPLTTQGSLKVQCHHLRKRQTWCWSILEVELLKRKRLSKCVIRHILIC